MHRLQRFGHESGQVPVGQLEPEDDDVPDFAANVEKTFSVSFDPHFSQACNRLVFGFSRNGVTCPHLLHWYSNIGIMFLLIRVGTARPQCPQRRASSTIAR